MSLENQIEQAIREGLTARGTGRGYGCGRAYVSLGKVDRKTLAAYKNAIARVGLRYLTEAYGSGKRCIYVGYDNATGVPLAQAAAIAKNLQALGLPAYDDAVSD